MCLYRKQQNTQTRAAGGGLDTDFGTSSYIGTWRANQSRATPSILSLIHCPGMGSRRGSSKKQESLLGSLLPLTTCTSSEDAKNKSSSSPCCLLAIPSSLSSGICFPSLSCSFTSQHLRAAPALGRGTKPSADAPGLCYLYPNGGNRQEVKAVKDFLVPGSQNLALS